MKGYKVFNHDWTCRGKLNEELKIQRQIVSNGNNAIVSYHAGICSGLNIALKLLEANTRSVNIKNGK